MRIPAIASLVLTLFLVSCVSQRYAANKNSQAAAQQWLAAQNQDPAVNITGRWHSTNWKFAAFVQGDRRINGQVGTYTAYGKASGSRVYLVLSEGGLVKDSLILTMPSSSTLTGYYSPSVPFDRSNQTPVTFTLLK